MERASNVRYFNKWLHRIVVLLFVSYQRATKLVIKLKNKSYIDRLIYLNLPNLKYRRLRGDMIEVFKITHNTYDRTVSPDLPLNERANTRGNHYKLQNHTFHYDLRKHFFLHAL